MWLVATCFLLLLAGLVRYVFNGRFRISVRGNRYFRDTEKINIESRFGEMLIEIYEKDEMIRLDREVKEEEVRKRAEAERRKEDRRQRYNQEVERTIALENAALDYETICRIRAYVKAVAVSCGHGCMG